MSDTCTVDQRNMRIHCLNPLSSLSLFSSSAHFGAASSPDENAPADGEIRSADGKLLKDWKVRERRYVEEMTPDTLRQVLTAAVAIPDLQSASVYQPMRQAGLLGTWVRCHEAITATKE